MLIRRKTYDALIAMADAVNKRTTETIEAKEETISSLQSEIKAKDETIMQLQERIKDLERRIQYHRARAVKANSDKKPAAKPKQKTWHGKTEYKTSTTTQNDGYSTSED